MLIKITDDNKTVALNWLRNQIAKGNSIFSDMELGQDAYFHFTNVDTFENGVVSLSDIEISSSSLQSFVNRYLSSSAKAKLSTTLRVSNSRMGAKMLQVKIDHLTKCKLDYLVSKTGLNRGEIVSGLINIADVGHFIKEHPEIIAKLNLPDPD